MVTRPERTLREELGRLFAVVTLLLTAVAVLAGLSFVHLLDSRQTLIDRIDPSNVVAAQLLTYYVDEETGVRGYVLTGQSLFLQPYQSGTAEAAGAQRTIGHLLGNDQRGYQQLGQVQAAIAAWEHQFAQPAIASEQSDPRANPFASTAAQDLGKNLFDRVRAAVDGLQRQLSGERSRAIAGLDDATTQLSVVLIVGAMVLLITAATVWRSMRRRVIAPLTEVGDDTRVVTAGDLSHPVSGAGPFEIAELAANIEAMRLRILDEVTAVRQSEARLSEANADLSRSNAELEQFAYVASHDLQEPLRKVASFCQLIEQRYGDQLDERGHSYIEFAVDGAKRMQVLINDLLAFSRIGRTTDHFDDVPLGVAVAAALANLAGAVEDGDVEVDVAPDLPTVRGDKGLLVSLMQNLIGNAIKFRSSDGPVKVGVEAQRRGTDWEISVWDNGIGIEPRFAERIFVIFQRLHSRDAYNGTGIGLAMCKKIVEFHGGRIWLDTEQHSGTRFRFTIPVDQPKEDQQLELDRSDRESRDPLSRR